MLLGVCLVAGSAACGRQRDVSVRVSIPGPDSLETPAAGVGVVALPYDRDSVLAASRRKPDVRGLHRRAGQLCSRGSGGLSPPTRA